MPCDLCELDEALYECWFCVKDPFTGRRIINQRHCVCKKCAKLSIAYERNGEKAFELAEEELELKRENKWCYQI